MLKITRHGSICKEVFKIKIRSYFNPNNNPIFGQDNEWVEHEHEQGCRIIDIVSDDSDGITEHDGILTVIGQYQAGNHKDDGQIGEHDWPDWRISVLIIRIW